MSQKKKKACPYCGKSYLNLTLHITKSHGEKELENDFPIMIPSVEKGIKPYKNKTAMLFALWLSMPFAVHTQSASASEKLGYDVKDELLDKLLSCRTRMDFAEEFNVNRRTLHEWEKDQNIQAYVEAFNKYSNVTRFKKDVDFAFTRKTIENADAGRVKLWKQLYEGYTEKTIHDIPALEELGRELKEIANKR
jgi:hypothetical protein